MASHTPTIELPDRYRLSGHIANGGMASVWAAEDRTLGRLVAFKLLAPQFMQDPGAVRRFEREARAAAALSGHPNVVTIYDVGEHEGRPYIVMEYLTGGSVADVLRQGRVDRSEALDWLGEAAAALDAAHERGIIHRDIKPANLLLDERRRLAVGDFGIARLAYDDTPTTSAGQITSTGQVLGTAAYLAPEQAAGEPVTSASDRYALAVVAYELLTGRRPFEARGFAAQARQHVEERPAPPSRHDPGLPEAADDVLLRGLAKDPERRWRTAGEMIAALQQALRGDAPAQARPAADPTMAMPAPVRQAEPEPVTPPEPEPTPEPVLRPPPPRPPAGTPRRDRRRPSRAPALLALLAVAGVAIAVAAIASSGGGSDDTGGRASAPAAKRETNTDRPARRRSPATPAASPTSTAQAPAGTPPSGSASSLNARGKALSDAGRYDEAIPLLQQAVKGCPASTLDPCAYALFNLGHALRLAGRPDEAVPVLEQRLQNPDQRGTVQAELDAARRAAGGGAAPPGKAKKPGKGPKKG